MRLQHSDAIPALPRSVRRTLWWLKLWRPSEGKSELSAHAGDLRAKSKDVTHSSADTSNFPDLPGGAGDREAQHHRAPASTNRPFRLATFNCRTLKAPWRRGLLAQLAKDLHIDVLMLQELSILSGPDLQHEDLGGGWTLFFTSASSRGNGGVGALISPRPRNSVACHPLTSRLLRVDLRLRRRTAHLFCAYAPTAAKPEEASEFFDHLSAVLDDVAHRNTLVVLGDLNAVMRRSDLAPFVTLPENGNTDALVNLIEQHDLVSVNTTFRKPEHRLATFAGCKKRRRNATGPNATTRLAQLDHVLMCSRERRRVRNCDTITPLIVHSDHKLLYCDILLKDPLYRPPRGKSKRNFSALRNATVGNQFTRVLESALDKHQTPDYSEVCRAIHSAAERTLPLVKPSQLSQPVWMSDPKIQKARKRVQNLRRQKRPSVEAEQVLASIYKEQERAAVKDAIHAVSSAVPDRKASAVWTAIDILTGRKRHCPNCVPGDTAEERKRELKNFFESTVNLPSPPLPNSLPLPPNTPLPDPENFNTGAVSSSEVIAIAMRNPGGKAAGPDGVPAEVLRIPRVASEVARLINNVMLDGEAAPPEWTMAYMVPIPKKAGSAKVEDYRGISLMSCAAKTYNKILLTRLQPVLDPFLRKEQNGFRPRRSTVTQILALRRVIEESKVHKADLVCIFVDFQKAFDSVARDSLPLILRAYNVPEMLITAVMALYNNTSAAVITPDGLTDTFTTSSGVLQGDTLAPFLFVLVLDWVLRTSLSSRDDGYVLCKRTSSRHPEKRLAFLAYADDLALLASSAENAQRMLNALAETASRVGLVINDKKTKVLTVPTDLQAAIQLPSFNSSTPSLLPRCEEFRYLGGLVPSVREDIRRRRRLAWAAFRSVRVVLQSTALSNVQRGRLFQAVVETVLLYNAETWTLTDAHERLLNATHTRMLRAAFRAHHLGSTTNAALYQLAGLQPPSEVLRRRRTKMAGHVLRARTYCPEPLQETLLLSLQGQRRRGQARTRSYVEQLFEDVNAPDQVTGVRHVEQLAEKRLI